MCTVWGGRCGWVRVAESAQLAGVVQHMYGIGGPDPWGHDLHRSQLTALPSLSSPDRRVYSEIRSSRAFNTQNHLAGPQHSATAYIMRSFPLGAAHVTQS